jgi:hypothetical protein
MGWLVRPSGRRYYYRYRLVGGKYVSEYVGTGPHAERAAALVLRRREQRRAERAEKKAELARLKQFEQEQIHFIDLADLMARMCLTAAGYRQQDRGAWHKRKPKPAAPGEVPTSHRTHTLREGQQ